MWSGAPTIACMARISYKEQVQRMREDAIVEAVNRLLATKGYDNMTVDEVAALAGFPTSDVMIAALAGLRSKDRWVAEQAHARMAELHPSVLDDRTRLRALVEDGLSKYTSDRILREDADLRRRADNGATAPAVDALRRAAELIAQKRTLDNLNASAVLGASASRLCTPETGAVFITKYGKLISMWPVPASRRMLSRGRPRAVAVSVSIALSLGVSMSGNSSSSFRCS